MWKKYLLLVMASAFLIWVGTQAEKLYDGPGLGMIYAIFVPTGFLFFLFIFVVFDARRQLLAVGRWAFRPLARATERFKSAPTRVHAAAFSAFALMVLLAVLFNRDRIELFFLSRKLQSSDVATASEALQSIRERGWLEDGSLDGKDLSGANLAGAALSGVDLSGAELRVAVLDGAADLSRANLYRASMQDVNLKEADLSFASLLYANLLNAVLVGASMGDASLHQANLTSADLSQALIVRVDLTEADLSQAILTGANLRGADLTGAILIGAKLTDTVFSHQGFLEKATLPDGSEWNQSTDLTQFTSPSEDGG